MARLVTHVSLRNDEGNVVSFGPGDDVPDWARSRITNPKVWDDEVPAVTEVTETPPPPPGDEPPPLAGEGSGRDVWAAYATTHGVTVEPDDKRAEIVARLRKAGFRVE